ncbi:MAG: Gfo/Idh/MocA family oxidoreductase [Solobacterium sp.]|nr:Gfo/Idh/MocA family oxidoreductase [Solobacterium sp.]
MGNIIRFGILSCASIVPRFVKGLELTETAEVTAIASRSFERARRTAAELAIGNFYAGYEELLADAEIDAVYIPLINSLHYPYAKKALEAGKHVIMEKPFVLHREEAEELAALAEKKNLFITEAVKTPFLPVYKEVKKILDEETYGKIQFMEFRQSYTSGPYISGWNKEKEAGGGVLYGNEAYFFHMAEFLAGRIVSCTGSATFGEEVEDQCVLSAVTENNVMATLFVSTQVLFNNGLIIHLDQGRIEIPDYWKASEAYIYQNNELKEHLSFPHQYELQYELTHYCKCILEGKTGSPVTPVENSARYIEWCEKLYRSWQTEKG